MKFQVTQQDIDDANDWRHNPEKDGSTSANCPVARCLQRRYPGARATACNIWFSRFVNMPAPYSVQLFISLWDTREDVEPFEFEVDYENGV